MLSVLIHKLIVEKIRYLSPGRKYFAFSSLSTKIRPRQTMNYSSQVIAVAQMTATNNKEENFANLETLVKKAASKGAQIVFLPEACDYIAESKKQFLEFAERQDGPTLSKYCQLARSLQIWLSIGGMHIKEEEDDKISNTHFIINYFGKIVAKYAKTHLFSAKIPENNIDLRESNYVQSGFCIPDPVVTPCGLLALGICYDMRFPEFSLLHRKANAQILSFPSAFTVSTGLAHWHTLLRARAIETQCYVVAAAQVGEHNGKRSSFGHSLIIDPWGAVIAEVSEGTDVACAEVDLKYLQKVRREMPIFTHRRNDLYSLHKLEGVSSEPGLTELMPFPCDFITYPFGQVSLPGSCIFLQTRLGHAFVNKKPVTPGHALVAPKRPTLRFCDMNETEVSDLSQAIVLTLLVLMKEHAPNHVQIAIQDGVFAGQTIKHVHAHLLPWPKEGSKLFENHEAKDGREWRDVGDMADEARSLRRHTADIDANNEWLSRNTFTNVQSTNCSGSESMQFYVNEVTIQPESIVHQSENWFAFLPGNSILPGHVCVCPSVPVSSLSDFSPTGVSEIFIGVQRIQKAVENYYDACSSTIYMNSSLEGKDFLVHILPRKENDLPQNDDVYNLLLNFKIEAPDDSKKELLSYLKNNLAAKS